MSAFHVTDIVTDIELDSGPSPGFSEIEGENYSDTDGTGNELFDFDQDPDEEYVSESDSHFSSHDIDAAASFSKSLTSLS